jgi:hypothetical protein
MISSANQTFDSSLDHLIFTIPILGYVYLWSLSEMERTGGEPVTTPCRFSAFSWRSPFIAVLSKELTPIRPIFSVLAHESQTKSSAR